jgi:mannose-6-phosphate isomerase-like protein (cupin superfamily)
MRQAVEFIPREAQQVVDLQGGSSSGFSVATPCQGRTACSSHTNPEPSPPGEEFVRHAGHEFNYLVACRVVIEVGTQRFELKPGDTLTFPATTSHRLSNPWAETAEIVCVFVSSPGPRTAVTI